MNNLNRNSLWPDGIRVTEVQFRDAEVQLRTLVAAKCALMSSVSGKLIFFIVIVNKSFMFNYMYIV